MDNWDPSVRLSSTVEALKEQVQFYQDLAFERAVTIVDLKRRATVMLDLLREWEAQVRCPRCGLRFVDLEALDSLSLSDSIAADCRDTHVRIANILLPGDGR